MGADEQLREANWGRMRDAIRVAAREFRRTADELEAIQFVRQNGKRRTPDSIISQAALIMNTNAESILIHRLATWAETINEIDQHEAAPRLCGYQITDPVTRCVLAPGHTLPTDDGLMVHVSADGVMFS